MKNIREIAELSQVSVATVSRYVNNNGYVSEKTANKIKSVIEEYGYSPNKLTTAIISGRSNDIGLIVHNLKNPYFSQLIDEIEKHAQLNNLNLIICNARGNEYAENNYFQELMSKRVSGIAVINTINEQIYANTSIPIVGIEKRILNYPWIKADNQKGMEILLDSINNLKAKRTLIITSAKPNFAAQERLNVCEKYLTRIGSNYNIVKLNDKYKRILEFKIEPQNYDLIICWNDMVAHGIVSKLHKQGIDIPSQIEVVGFDGLLLNELFTYQLTTVKQNISEIGKQSFEMLNDMINGRECNDHIVNVELINGQTTN